MEIRGGKYMKKNKKTYKFGAVAMAIAMVLNYTTAYATMFRPNTGEQTKDTKEVVQIDDTPIHAKFKDVSTNIRVEAAAEAETFYIKVDQDADLTYKKHEFIGFGINDWIVLDMGGKNFQLQSYGMHTQILMDANGDGKVDPATDFIIAEIREADPTNRVMLADTPILAELKIVGDSITDKGVNYVERGQGKVIVIESVFKTYDDKIITSGGTIDATYDWSVTPKPRVAEEFTKKNLSLDTSNYTQGDYKFSVKTKVEKKYSYKQEIDITLYECNVVINSAKLSLANEKYDINTGILDFTNGGENVMPLELTNIITTGNCSFPEIAGLTHENHDLKFDYSGLMVLEGTAYAKLGELQGSTGYYLSIDPKIQNDDKIVIGGELADDLGDIVYTRRNGSKEKYGVNQTFKIRKSGSDCKFSVDFDSVFQDISATSGRHPHNVMTIASIDNKCNYEEHRGLHDRKLTWTAIDEKGKELAYESGISVVNKDDFGATIMINNDMLDKVSQDISIRVTGGDRTITSKPFEVQKYVPTCIVDLNFEDMPTEIGAPALTEGTTTQKIVTKITGRGLMGCNNPLHQNGDSNHDRNVEWELQDKDGNKLSEHSGITLAHTPGEDSLSVTIVVDAAVLEADTQIQIKATPTGSKTPDKSVTSKLITVKKPIRTCITTVSPYLQGVPEKLKIEVDQIVTDEVYVGLNNTMCNVSEHKAEGSGSAHDVEIKSWSAKDGPTGSMEGITMIPNIDDPTKATISIDHRYLSDDVSEIRIDASIEGQVVGAYGLIKIDKVQTPICEFEGLDITKLEYKPFKNPITVGDYNAEQSMSLPIEVIPTFENHDSHRCNIHDDDPLHGKKLVWTHTGDITGITLTKDPVSDEKAVLKVNARELTLDQPKIVVAADVLGDKSNGVSEIITIHKKYYCNKAATTLGTVNIDVPAIPTKNKIYLDGEKVVFGMYDSTGTIDLNLGVGNPIFSGNCDYEDIGGEHPDGVTNNHVLTWFLKQTHNAVTITTQEDGAKAIIAVDRTKLIGKDTEIEIGVTGNGLVVPQSRLATPVGKLTIRNESYVEPPPPTEGGNESSQWEDLVDDIKDADKDDVIKVDISDDPKVPASVVNEIEGEDITLELYVGDDFTWIASGDNLKKLPKYQLFIPLGVSEIKDSGISKLAKSKDVSIFEMTHTNSLFGTYVLRKELGKDYKEDTMYLYMYNPKTKALSYKGSAKSDKNGSVEFPVTYGGTYVITDTGLGIGGGTGSGVASSSNAGGGTGGGTGGGGTTTWPTTPSPTPVPPVISSSEISSSSESSESASWEPESISSLPEESSEETDDTATRRRGWSNPYDHTNYFGCISGGDRWCRSIDQRRYESWLMTG